MARIDVTYDILLQNILKNGFRYEDPNRKGVYRLQIPSYTIEHDLTHSFPAITTKKLYWKGVVGELLWFLRGDTNIKWLIDNDINIWNKDAYNHYLNLYQKNRFKVIKPVSFERFIEGVEKDEESIMVDYEFGSLGRVYGAQWKAWKGSEPNEYTVEDHERPFYIDQISNLIRELKQNPMGTRHIVTAWNPAEIYDMALPPCHWSFEILVEPDNSFTLKWHQRSVDVFLGLPFNIASYALLAEIIGLMTGLKPKKIIGDLSNVHIYEPHLDAVKEQMKRDMYKFDECQVSVKANQSFNAKDPKLNVDKFLNGLEISDFMLWQYESHPPIKAEMIPYS